MKPTTTKSIVCGTCRHRVTNKYCIDGIIFCPVFEQFQQVLKPQTCPHHQVLDV